MSERSVLRRGMGLVRELVGLHPVPFAISVSGAVLFAGALVGASYVLGEVVDRVVAPTYRTGELAPNTLAWAAAAIVAVTVLRMIGVVFRRYFAGMTSERVQVTFRHRLTERYLGLPMSWHQRTPTGELLALSDADVEKSVDLLHPLPFSIGAACIAVFSLGYLLTIDPYITLVALAVFPALGLINNYYSKRIEEPAAAGQAAVGKVSSIAHESFEGALVVKTLGRSVAEGERFDRASQELRHHRVLVGYLRAVFEPVLDIIPSLGILAAVVVSGYRIEAGAMTVGNMITVTTLFSVLAFPVRVFGYFLETVPPSLVSRERLNRVFDETLPARQDGRGRRLPDGPLRLDIADMNFSYPVEASEISEQVLDKVSFSVEPGEVVALVGSTGVGKSTLCQLVAGLVPPDQGKIKIGGIDLEAIDPIERTDAIALVFQESFMFADSIAANIDVSNRATVGEIEHAADLAQVVSFVDEMPNRYDTLLGERGVNLSGGQRQRVALARALVRRPRLLILDDATSAVDPKVEQQILSRLGEELNTTTLVVAQRVATIMLADRVLYLADGTIVASGTHEELMGIEGYENLVRAYEEAS